MGSFKSFSGKIIIEEKRQIVWEAFWKKYPDKYPNREDFDKALSLTWNPRLERYFDNYRIESMEKFDSLCAYFLSINQDLSTFDKMDLEKGRIFEERNIFTIEIGQLYKEIEKGPGPIFSIVSLIILALLYPIRGLFYLVRWCIKMLMAKN